jgi:hypothetical protein
MVRDLAFSDIRQAAQEVPLSTLMQAHVQLSDICMYRDNNHLGWDTLSQLTPVDANCVVFLTHLIKAANELGLS